MSWPGLLAVLTWPVSRAGGQIDDLDLRAARGLDMQHQLAGLGAGRDDARPRRQGDGGGGARGTGLGRGGRLRPCARLAIRTCAWRIKPQTTPKRASTTSPLMIMTMTHAVRWLVAGRKDGSGMSDTESGTKLSQDARTALAEDAHAGWRLDRFLAAALPDFSRSRLQQLLEARSGVVGRQETGR